MRRFIVALLCTVTLGVSAFGQTHHPLHADFYRHWRDPANPNLSCCDARIEKDGHETGDCEPSKAEVRDGDWFVWIRQTGEWKRVPDEKRIRERNPSGQDAHVCWTPIRGIICFVPPDTGL